MKKFQITPHCIILYLAMIGCYTVRVLYEGLICSSTSSSDTLKEPKCFILIHFAPFKGMFKGIKHFNIPYTIFHIV